MPLYFAFGSNMDTGQMAARCPGAQALGLATLEAHGLVFRGPSRHRGGGVLSVDEMLGDHVRGLLYQVSDVHIEALDRFEGAPAWYERVHRAVIDDEGMSHTAVLYRLPSRVVEMPPTPAYLAQVVAAFQVHGTDVEALLNASRRAKRETS